MSARSIGWLEGLSQYELNALRRLLVCALLRKGEHPNHVAAALDWDVGPVYAAARQARIEYKRQPRFGSEKRLRNEKIAVERLQGKTLAEIGRIHGITRERVRQIIARAKNGKLVESAG